MSKFHSVHFLFLSPFLSLQLALSSDKISSLNTPLLGLSLDVKENQALRSVTMEMNREELNTLISSLEAANKVNTHLSPVCLCVYGNVLLGDDWDNLTA